MLMQIHQHVLLQPCLTVIDSNAVVVPVQAVDECLDRRLIQVTQIGCGLPRLLTHDHSLGLNKSESINNNFALDGLDRVNDNGDSARGELLEGLLGVDIDR